MTDDSKGVVGWIVGLVMVMFLMAYTMPEALIALTNSTAYGDTSTAVISIFTIVLPILVAFAIVIKILPSEVKSKVGL